jgi:hypothetical protein
MVNKDDEITVLPPVYEKPHEIVQTKEYEESTVETIDERIEPSDEDLAKLRRVSETIPFRAWYSNTLAYS